jgi:hypothetical protein
MGLHTKDQFGLLLRPLRKTRGIKHEPFPSLFLHLSPNHIHRLGMYRTWYISGARESPYSWRAQAVQAVTARQISDTVQFGMT